MQLRFDVKGCLFLSSGVDSSILAAHLSKYHNSSNLIAYSLDNNVPNYSEYSEAKKIADQFNFELRKVKYDFNIVPNKIDEVMNILLQLRNDARNNKNFDLSDKIRDLLKLKGITINDNDKDSSYTIE